MKVIARSAREWSWIDPRLLILALAPTMLVVLACTSTATRNDVGVGQGESTTAVPSSGAGRASDPTALPTVKMPPPRDSATPSPDRFPVKELDLDALPVVETEEEPRRGPSPAPLADEPIGHMNTSGRPGRSSVSAMSLRARLFAVQTFQDNHCVGVYKDGGSSPLWTRCFTSGENPSQFTVSAFSPDGKKLAGYTTRRDEIVSTDGHPRSTLLFLDARTGKLLHYFDRDLGVATGNVRYEGNANVIFSDSTLSRNAPEEEGFTRWLVRCTLSGVCERATPPIETSWYETARWPH
jgi:hypothetical protein